MVDHDAQGRPDDAVSPTALSLNAETLADLTADADVAGRVKGGSGTCASQVCSEAPTQCKNVCFDTKDQCPVMVPRGFAGVRP
jgi:hypothetical protein